MNDPKMPVYAERFLQLYPETSWQPLVQEAMEKNRAFNQTRIPEDLHFPDVSQAKTFQDIIAPYKGKVIFMDIWATWCGPCRDSFAFVKPLQEYAQEKILFCCISRLIIRKLKRNGRRWLLIMI